MYCLLSLEHWDRGFDSDSRHRCMPAFYVTLLVGTPDRHLVQIVQPNVYMKTPNPENGRLWAALRMQQHGHRCEQERLTYRSVSRWCCGGVYLATRKLWFTARLTVEKWGYFRMRFGCKTPFIFHFLFIWYNSQTYHYTLHWRYKIWELHC